MTASPNTVQNVAHRMRVAAHTAAAQVDSLEGCTAEERADLRCFVSFIAECADKLFPVIALDYAERTTAVRPLLRAFQR